MAQVARVWRQAIDRCKQAPEQFEVAAPWQTELDALSEGSQTTLGAYHR
nr:U32 family peptidase [Candidatus Pantoea persica]